MIPNFDGAYRWLSNMFPCKPFEDEYGITHRYSETYYMAEKTDELDMKLALSKMTGFDAKKHAKSFNIEKPEWRGSPAQIDAMRRAIIYKFTDTELADKLVATYPMYIREGNKHHDKFFGHCEHSNAGCNVLGHLLMEHRDVLIAMRAGTVSV
jgi:predicted NAD-dependent protein-ADP-ribosyltransferase YbiA (DUF1768 family)